MRKGNQHWKIVRTQTASHQEILAGIFRPVKWWNIFSGYLGSFLKLQHDPSIRQQNKTENVGKQRFLRAKPAGAESQKHKIYLDSQFAILSSDTGSSFIFFLPFPAFSEQNWTCSTENWSVQIAVPWGEFQHIIVIYCNNFGHQQRTQWSGLELRYHENDIWPKLNSFSQVLGQLSENHQQSAHLNFSPENIVFRTLECLQCLIHCSEREFNVKDSTCAVAQIFEKVGSIESGFEDLLTESGTS